MKKTLLGLLCLLLILTLAGCTAVNKDNSFQNQAGGEIVTQNTTDTTDTQTVEDGATAAPTQDPNGTGYNG